MSTLRVWLDDAHVADLDDTSGFGTASLRYTEQACERFGLGAIALSVRLPVRERPYPAVEARNWLNGLLPEGELRAVLAGRYRLAETDTFGLLAKIGRECAGAVVITGPDEGPPARAGVHWLDEPTLARAVDDLAAAPFGVGTHGQVRVSLGGMQDKLVLVQGPDGRLGLPLESTPSTHILKPAPLKSDGSERWPGLVHAELFGMRVLEEADLDVAQVRFRPVAGRPALLVRRYDRERLGQELVRLHQEDMCQALGIPPTEKYQKRHDPLSPSLARIARVIADHGAAPAVELERLAQLVIGSLVLGNCDQHAKNISVLLDPVNGLRLAPAYDVVPTESLGVDPALSLLVGDTALLNDLAGAVIDDELARWGVGPRAAVRMRRTVLDRLEPALVSARESVATEAGDHEVLDRACAQSFRRLESFR